MSPLTKASRWWRRPVLPAVLRAAMEPDERILVTAPCEDGRMLAVSRFGLWVVTDPSGPAAGAERIGWELIARARLTARMLTVLSTRVADRIDTGDGLGDQVTGAVQVLVDEPELVFALATRSGLTDVVHNRVRRSVAASRHLPYPGAGGWVVLRRVPGRNGLTRQVRLDPGADLSAPGFAAAVLAVADELADTMPAG
ncbi:MAG TPA: hypothetical protein PKY70_10360 [Nakamurella multipartita]|nr:hypothetical protein [Nakamurella multipartita]